MAFCRPPRAAAEDRNYELVTLGRSLVTLAVAFRSG